MTATKLEKPKGEMMSATTWNPEELIIRRVTNGREQIKVHEGYWPLVLALVCRGLIRIVEHVDGLIEIGPPKGTNDNDH